MKRKILTLLCFCSLVTYTCIPQVVTGRHKNIPAATLCPGGTTTMSVLDGTQGSGSSYPGPLFQTVANNAGDVIVAFATDINKNMTSLTVTIPSDGTFTSSAVSGGSAYAYITLAAGHGAFSQQLQFTCTGASFCNYGYFLVRGVLASTIIGQVKRADAATGTTMTVGTMTGGSGSTFLGWWATSAGLVTHDAAWTKPSSMPADNAASRQGSYKIANSVTAVATQSASNIWNGIAVEVCAAP